MLDKFLVLLERFVVAHELIAANSARRTVTNTAGDVSVTITEAIKEGAIADAIKTTADVARLKQEPEDDLDDEEPEGKPKRKPRQAKPKDEPKGPDVAKLREEIRTIAKAIATGDSDECADKFDELLEDYKVRTVNKLADEDVEAFHKDATKLVGKYYEIEE
ncbi:hypothetical protein DQ853_23450 [Salmonella enterica subsp. enterica]|uniref:13.88 kDa late protein n=1 Tax=Salmonella phage TS6 TaxID=2491323 RepID=A0A5S9BG13_9CAUD|nr:hypothetical protein PF620_gp08 [Salmonella phage TS6]AZF89051.1 hypothetical protein AP6_008 [Salmonella phage TS6]ECI4718663.1 hypothetical protein [Salmonella enterica subsp. enterica]